MPKVDKRLLCPKCKTLGTSRGQMRGHTYLRCPRWQCATEWAVRGYVDVPLRADVAGEPAPVRSVKRQRATRRRVREAKKR